MEQTRPPMRQLVVFAALALWAPCSEGGLAFAPSAGWNQTPIFRSCPTRIHGELHSGAHGERSGSRRAAPRSHLALPLRNAARPFSREVASKLSSEDSPDAGSSSGAVSIVVSFLRATQLRSSPSMPIIGNSTPRPINAFPFHSATVLATCSFVSWSQAVPESAALYPLHTQLSTRRAERSVAEIPTSIH
jgi:hypothetical protein